MSICEISQLPICKLAIPSTIQISKSDKKFTITPNTAAMLGSKKDRIIFKNPIVRIKATSGKAITVQILVRGLIV